MGMRIRTNVASLTAQRYLSKNMADQGDSLERLSSGYRINKSADDAAGLAISENLRGKIRGLGVAKRNASDAVSMVQIAEGSMNEMTNILVRMRELTVQAASDTVGDKERGFLNREYTQLVDEMDRIASTTEFNGNKFFRSEDRNQLFIQVGVTSEADSALTVNLENLKFDSEALGLGKGDEIGSDNGSLAREDIAGKLNTIDSALSRIASERATLGSVQSRLTSTMGNLDINVENMNTARSRIKDVDFAAETANMAQTRILTQSNTAVLSQANGVPELALQLLR